MLLKSLAQSLFGEPVDLDSLDRVIGPAGLHHFRASSVFSGRQDGPQTDFEYYSVARRPDGQGWDLIHTAGSSMQSESAETTIEAAIPDLAQAVAALRRKSDEDIRPAYGGLLHRLFHSRTYEEQGENQSLSAVEGALRTRGPAPPGRPSSPRPA